MTARPNFLFITTDQHCADHLGCYGNPVVHTPQIDSLAAQGRRFSRFHVATSVCMPNRATLMTGRMPSVHGLRCNGIPLSQQSTTFVDLLRAAGYRTGLAGKCHLQNMTDLPPQMPVPPLPLGLTPPPQPLADAVQNRWDHGRYDNELLNRWRDDPAHRVQTPYYGFDHVDLCTMHGDMVDGEYARWLSGQVGDIDALRGPGNALPDARYRVPQGYRTRIPEHLYPSRWIADRAIAQIDAAADTAQPFFLHCSFPDPHHPFTPPGHYWDMYDPESIELPASFGDKLQDVFQPVAELRRERQEGRARVQSTVAYAAEAREVREAIALTYGMITMIDDMVGRLLAHLRARGLDRNTVVIFTSDHGDFMGSHGLLLKSALHYQSLIRVPFIWAEPGMNHPGQTSPGLASTVDIARSVLERAGLAPYAGIQGHSLLPCLEDPSHRLRQALLIEEDGHAPTFGLDVPVRMRTVLTEQHRLSIYDQHAWAELYDFASDPHEQHNLIDDTRSQGIRASMFEALAREMMMAHDRVPMPTGRA